MIGGSVAAIFVEADANRVVQRVYWTQFEAHVPSRAELKHNYTDPVEQIQGIDFHVKSHFAETDERDEPALREESRIFERPRKRAAKGPRIDNDAQLPLPHDS